MSSLVCIDFESFYDKQFSLSKLTTEEYVNSEQFEVIGVGVKVDANPTVFHTGTKEELKTILDSYDIPSNILLCHNTFFDATILSEYFGIVAKRYLDTLSMARAIHGISVGGSLAKLAEHYGIGVKGTEVINALGKHLKDFSPEELQRYGEYCINDVDLTYELFHKLMHSFNTQELSLIDITLKMAVKPTLTLDLPMLEAYLHEVRAKKEELLSRVVADRKEIMSNPKFAALLESMGVDVPMKVSPTTGKLTYAFAKTDDGLKELLEHENPDVQALVATRLGVKSTIEETRTERFIGIAKRTNYLPIPLNYYGAATGRWSAGGGQKVNFQNLPRDSTLKKSVIAPEGHVVVGADLSNIELRVGLWVCGEMDALKSLGDGRDLYKEFASLAFNVDYDEVTKAQRFIGKTSCIEEGQLVLTERGLIPIQKIKVDDTVWDGVEWVHHDGVIYMGERNVITYQGLTATPDHIVFMEDGSSCTFKDAADKNARIAVTGNGREAFKFMGDSKYRDSTNTQIGRDKNRSSVCMWNKEVGKCKFDYKRKIQAMPCLWDNRKTYKTWTPNSFRFSNKTITETSVSYIPTLPKSQRQRVFKLWRSGNRMQIQIGKRVSRLLINTTRRGYKSSDRQGRQQWALRKRESKVCYTKREYTKSQKYFDGILARRANTSSFMEGEPLYTNEYSVQVCTARAIWRRYNSTSSSSSSRQTEELETNTQKVRVYDIVNAGTRHRYTVSGVLVHNCLSLVFGVGADKLRGAVKAGSGTDLGEIEAKRIVDLYRRTYTGVTDFWKVCSTAISAIADDREFTFGRGGLYKVEGRKGVKLPSGLYMQYPQLENVVDAKTGETGYKYKLRNGYDRLFKTKLTNNLVQGTARCIMSEAMVRIAKKYQIALSVHDALYIVAPENEAQEVLDFLIEEMCRPPLWMPDIPLAAEGGWGRSIADC